MELKESSDTLLNSRHPFNSKKTQIQKEEEKQIEIFSFYSTSRCSAHSRIVRGEEGV